MRLQGTMRRGFSLLEVMLVLAIIAIMTAAVAISVSGMGERAKIKATKSMLGTIQQAIKAYELDKSAVPQTLQTLQGGGKLSYLDPDKKLLDAWGEQFLYSPSPANGHDYQLFSKGPDKQFQTADDIDVWKLDAN